MFRLQFIPYRAFNGMRERRGEKRDPTNNETLQCKELRHDKAESREAEWMTDKEKDSFKEEKADM